MFFLCKQKTAYEMRISDWSSDVCSSDLGSRARVHSGAPPDRPVRSRGRSPIRQARSRRREGWRAPRRSRRSSAGVPLAERSAENRVNRSCADYCTNLCLRMRKIAQIRQSHERRYRHNKNIKVTYEIGQASCRERVCQYVYYWVVAG